MSESGAMSIAEANASFRSSNVVHAADGSCVEMVRASHASARITFKPQAVANVKDLQSVEPVGVITAEIGRHQTKRAAKAKARRGGKWGQRT